MWLPNDTKHICSNSSYSKQKQSTHSDCKSRYLLHYNRASTGCYLKHFFISVALVSYCIQNSQPVLKFHKCHFILSHQTKPTINSYFIHQWSLLSLQKQPLEVFYKKMFLKISQNPQENSCGRASFLNKVAGWALQLVQMFSCEFCEIFKNTFFTEHLWTTASVAETFHAIP